MRERFGHGEYRHSKAQGVSDALNRLLYNLVLRCAKSAGIRDYFYVAVIGYGHPVGTLFGGALAGKALVPISLLADHPLRIEKRERLGEGGERSVVNFPLWIEPKAYGWTYMCEALRLAETLVDQWVLAYPRSYPPLVFNLTDGGATDGDPRPITRTIMAKSTTDGNALSFTLHLSSRSPRIVHYPVSHAGLPEPYAVRLFSMSSVLPDVMANGLRQDGFQLQAGARAFVYNADLTSVIQLLDIGTRPSQVR
jgi:hypothetical protein